MRKQISAFERIKDLYIGDIISLDRTIDGSTYAPEYIDECYLITEVHTIDGQIVHLCVYNLAHGPFVIRRHVYDTLFKIS